MDWTVDLVFVYLFMMGVHATRIETPEHNFISEESYDAIADLSLEDIIHMVHHHKKLMGYGAYKSSVRVGYSRDKGEVVKPVIFMHGIFDNPKEAQFPTNYITSKVPGSVVYFIDLYCGAFSVIGLNQQLNTILPLMQLIMKNHSDTGVTLMCFSQGGVLCRSAVQMLPDHNVHTLIILSSPLAGQYGLTSYLIRWFPGQDKSLLWKFLYTSQGQDISFGNYWNDPHHQNQFSDPKLDVLLARLNNLTGHNQSEEYRRNFLRVKRLVLIGGPNDTVITPWQSALMGYYDENENVIPMEQQPWYLNDAFGLKTLNEDGKVAKHIISGIEHIHWYRDPHVYECCVIPYI